MLKPHDFQEVFTRTPEEEPVLLILRAEGLVNQWRHAAVDLSAHAGAGFLASFCPTTDGRMPTSLRISDVSIRACRAGS